MNIDQILFYFDGVRGEGYGRYVSLCPCHNDTDPSLALRQDASTGNIIVACRVCSARMPEIATALGLQQRDFFGDPGAPGAIILPPPVDAPSDEELGALAEYLGTVRANIEPLEGYLDQRFAMSLETAKLLGLGYDDGGLRTRPTGFTSMGDGHTRLIISFMDPDGTDLGCQARRIDACSAPERWRGPAGNAWAKIACFGWDNDSEGQGPVIICEGPTDALAAASKGYASLGIRGAGNFSNEFVQNTVREYLGQRLAVVAADTGSAGQAAAKTLADALSLPVWTPDLGDDVADHLANGGTLETAVGLATAISEPVEPVPTAEELRDRILAAGLIEASRDKDLKGLLAGLEGWELNSIFDEIQAGAAYGTRRQVEGQIRSLRQAVRQLQGAGRRGPVGGGNGGGIHAPIPDGFDPTGLPEIIWNQEDQQHISEESVRQAMNAYGRSCLPDGNMEFGGEYYQSATGEYIKIVGDAFIVLEPADVGSMLSRMGHWRVMNGQRETGHVPEKAISIVKGEAWKCNLPKIQRRVDVPFMLANGDVVSQPGYYPENGIYLMPRTGDHIDIPAIPEVIADEHIAQAKQIFEDVTEGFMFKNHASKTNLIAMTLTSPLRELFSHNPMVPMLVSTAPQSGSGKGTSVRVPLSTAGIGPLSLSPTAYNQDENEFEKKLVGKLLKKPTYLFLDNIRTLVDSSVFEQMMTAANYDGRTLGYSQVNSLSTLVLWVATLQSTGKLNKDATRRCVPVELIKNFKGDWKHKNIEAYLAEMRGQMIWACFVVARKWIQDGRPVSEARLDGYGGWTEVIGGMVEHVLGYDEFLSNCKEFAQHQNATSMTIDGILERWLEQYGETPQQARMAVEDYEDQTLHKMLGLSGQPSTRMVSRAMSIALRSAVGHVVNNTHILEEAGMLYSEYDRKEALHFRLVPIPQGTEESTTVPDPA